MNVAAIGYVSLNYRLPQRECARKSSMLGWWRSRLFLAGMINATREAAARHPRIASNVATARE